MCHIGIGIYNSCNRVEQWRIYPSSEGGEFQIHRDNDVQRQSSIVN